MSFVYLIKSENDSLYKIGFATHVATRLKALQTGHPYPLSVIAAFASPHARTIERALHRTYSYARETGEWFALGLDIEIQFSAECERIERGIQYLQSHPID